MILLPVVIVARAAGGFLAVREIGGGGAQAEGSVTVTIPEGASTDGVARILKDEGLIGSELVFKIYSRLTGADGKYQMGGHEVAGGMSYGELIEALQKSTYKEIETVTITFPEGTTALKMAIMLEEKGFFTRDDFISACNNDTYSVGFFSEISDNELKFIKLEGFLYPDTYEFQVGSSAHDVVEIMLRNFEEKVLTDEIRAALENSEYSLEEIVILASIVEKESFNGEEKNVSSVFHNRLKPDSPEKRLQSNTSWDSTQEGFIHGVLDYYYGGKENVPPGMREAYDTYSIEGLPVGAICNPGVVMVDAALNPNDTNYYFFLTDNNKKFYWAETADQHSRNNDEKNKVNSGLAGD
jgi:UPF0755 protein